MTQRRSSPLLNALDRASIIFQARQAETHLPSLPAGEEDESDRGSLRGFPKWPNRSSTLAPNLETAETHLATVNAQITQIQAWLHANPDLLRILDQCIRNEVRQMEIRNNRTAILINTVFTLLGAIIGLILPPLLIWVSHLLGY